jgi:tetratricopeptide (TPR) repeat protein
MTEILKRTLYLCLPLALLAACSGAAPPRPPAVLESANAADQQARRAWREGDLPVARNLFEQSLRLQRSLDNLPGIAGAAINLASVYHAMNNDDMALNLLDGILADKLVPYPADLRAVAAFRKAVILVDGKSGDAPAAVEAAAQLCGGSCEFKAGLHNLRARMALDGKDYAAAASQAKQAADAAGDNKEELANARRHSAAANAAQGLPAPALEHYLAALELDKQLGAPRRIAEDLQGASTALEKLGRKDEAASYARRAAAAHDAVQSRAAVKAP